MIMCPCIPEFGCCGGAALNLKSFWITGWGLGSQGGVGSGAPSFPQEKRVLYSHTPPPGRIPADSFVIQITSFTQPLRFVVRLMFRGLSTASAQPLCKSSLSGRSTCFQVDSHCPKNFDQKLDGCLLWTSPNPILHHPTKIFIQTRPDSHERFPNPKTRS